MAYCNIYYYSRSHLPYSCHKSLDKLVKSCELKFVFGIPIMSCNKNLIGEVTEKAQHSSVIKVLTDVLIQSKYSKCIASYYIYISPPFNTVIYFKYSLTKLALGDYL